MATTNNINSQITTDYLVSELQDQLRRAQRRVEQYAEELIANPFATLTRRQNVQEAAATIKLTSMIIAEATTSESFTVDGLIADLTKRVLRAARGELSDGGGMGRILNSQAAELLNDLSRGLL